MLPLPQLLLLQYHYLHWPFLRNCICLCLLVPGLLLRGLFFACVNWGLLSSCGGWASRRCDLSCGAQALCVRVSWLRHVGSGAVVPGLESPGSGAVARGLSCSAARGICPDQG